MAATAEVRLWGRTIAAASSMDGQRAVAFQYVPGFARSGIEVAPLMMPLSTRIYAFPALPHESFRGLPGLLADSLPDRFGNALIDAWLATQGRNVEDFDAIERLCYTGTRGMGALEYAPARGPRRGRASALDLDALVDLASKVLSRQQGLQQSFATGRRATALGEILRVGTSAGGARAKAVVAWNPATQEVRSGQVPAPPGFESWLLKFDGVSGNRDKDLVDPGNFTTVEFAYSRMAGAAGIRMMPCRLLEENGRRHFMTKRFDRTDDGQKLHMQSLAALLHLDFNLADAHSYEQAFECIRRLAAPPEDREEQFRRMLFNVVARNQDDHVKNIAFLMDKAGQWRLSPAFDVTWAHNPQGPWTARHQMSINGRRDGFTREDLRACARVAGLNRGRADSLLEQVVSAVRAWPDFADEAGLPGDLRDSISRGHRLGLA